MAKKTCPKCGFTCGDSPGNVNTYFGYRKVPHPIAQSWCRNCRKAERKGKKTPVGMQTLEHIKVSGVLPMKPKQIEYTPRASLAARLAVQKLYVEHFPNDKQRRSHNTMLEKLTRKGVTNGGEDVHDPSSKV